LEELTKLADARKSSLFARRVLSFLRPEDELVKPADKPALKLVPFWRIKGFHECFYFRGNSYKIDLPDDVVAVEVEGKIRDIVGSESGDSQKLTSLTRRILGKQDWLRAKSFRLNEVTELAYMYKEGSIFVDADGRENLEAEAFFEGKVPLQRLTEDEVLRQFPEGRIKTSSISKDELVRRLHSTIVRPPPTFTRILSNRFQITQLARFLIPVYEFKFEWRGQRKELSVHGFTGGVFQ